MKIHKTLLTLICISITNLYAMNTDQLNHIDGDTLILKGKITTSNMEDKRGTKMEGVVDYYFSDGKDSYFIKRVEGGKFNFADLNKLAGKEMTIRAIKKFGNWDIDSEDPSYAQTRMGEYILILEIIE
jgi:hypothetical protein